MDQAKAIINLNEGVIQLEGPVEFVERYLEKYAPVVKGAPTPGQQAKTPSNLLNFLACCPALPSHPPQAPLGYNWLSLTQGGRFAPRRRPI